jgi:TRAP-type C4-dicarboxylate transport system permease small subunit
VRNRLIIGLIISSIMIISSVIMMLYTYHYSTTNRVGVVGNWDGEFHFKSIIPYTFTFISGTMLFISSLIQLSREKKRSA